jgi:hypothetical protein
MKKTMAEVAANIESRVTYDDAKRMLEEKVSKVGPALSALEQTIIRRH